MLPSTFRRPDYDENRWFLVRGEHGAVLLTAVRAGGLSLAAAPSVAAPYLQLFPFSCWCFWRFKNPSFCGTSITTAVFSCLSTTTKSSWLASAPLSVWIWTTNLGGVSCFNWLCWVSVLCTDVPIDDVLCMLCLSASGEHPHMFGENMQPPLRKTPSRFWFHNHGGP